MQMNAEADGGSIQFEYDSTVTDQSAAVTQHGNAAAIDQKRVPKFKYQQ